MLEATRLYVEGLSSYRVLSRILTSRYGRSVSAMTLNRWVTQVAAAARTPLEVSAELTAGSSSRWGGWLGIDGKAIWVRGEKHAAMVAVDHPSQDVVHALVVPTETGERLARLVTETVAGAGYPLKGLVTDLAPGFRQRIRDYFGDLPHQACRVHADRRLDQYIRKAKADPEAAALHAHLKARICQPSRKPFSVSQSVAISSASRASMSN
jgi:transposase-like protein